MVVVVAQMMVHFIPSGKTSKRNTLKNIVCTERESFANQGGATAHTLWP